MATRKNQAPPKNFEDALAELERILREIEGGEVPLEDSLVKYERGQFLIQHCRGVLGAAEKQIELLGKDRAGDLGVGVDAGGGLATDSGVRAGGSGGRADAVAPPIPEEQDT